MSNKEETASRGKHRGHGGKWNPFSSSVFCMVFSFVVAIVAWFTVSSDSIGSTEQPLNLQDVEIKLELSEAATSGGLHIFDQNETTADVKIRANNAIKSQLTKNDVTITGFFSPSSTKTSGTGLNTAVVTLRATKNNALSDYEVLEISPREITVQYDRVSEATFPLTDEIVRSAKTGYIVGDPIYSESSVVISGPESYVSQIARVAVKGEITEPLSKDRVLNGKLVLYSKDDIEIKNTQGMFLTMSVEDVEVTLPVLVKKTVPLEPTYKGRPTGFSESRITVTPATIDVAGAEEVVDSLSKITLEEEIRFSDVSFEKNTFNIDIPIPSNVQNINDIQHAEVSINLNGFKEVEKTTTNIKLLHPPSDNVAPSTMSRTIKVIGSEAQIAKLTGDMIDVTVDLSGWKADSGNMTLPAKVTINGMDTCWAVGEYTVTVDLSAASAVARVLEND